MGQQTLLFDIKPTSNKTLSKEELCFDEVKQKYPTYNDHRINYAIKTAGFPLWLDKREKVKKAFFSRVDFFITYIYPAKFIPKDSEEYKKEIHPNDWYSKYNKIKKKKVKLKLKIKSNNLLIWNL